MRILIIVPSINHVTGGPSRSSVALAKRLTTAGNETEIFSTNWPDCGKPSRNLLEDGGVRIHLFRASQAPGLKHLPYSGELISALRDRYTQFDIFICESLWNPLISHATAFLRQRAVPYAISTHGMLDPLVFDRNRIRKFFWSKLCEKRNVEQAQLLIFNSPREESKAKRSGWRLRQTIVVPHSVDLIAGQRLPPRLRLEDTYPQLKDKQVIAFVGRTNWVKNLDLLIKSTAQLAARKKDAILVCAGPDSDGHRAELEEIAKSVGIRENVIFTGMLEGEELLTIYARADVVALVSRKENFGLAAAEALAAGVPVVLSDGVDMGEDWQTPPVWRVTQDVDSIAAGLEAALEYSQKVGLPAQSALNLASSEWSASRCDTLVATFESILAAS